MSKTKSKRASLAASRTSQKKAVKKNHHYVPRFWLRGFASPTGQIHAWDGQRVRRVAVAKIMAEDWLYTLFDNAWNPSDALEDALGTIEGVAKPLFVKLQNSRSTITASDRSHICAFLALQACRHPDIMKRGRRRVADFIALIALAQEFESVDEFLSEVVGSFGASEKDARALYVYLTAINPELLRQGVNSLNSMSEHDPELPRQEVLRAQPQVEQMLLQMHLTLLECPGPMSFVLGDTPLPQEGLRHGFTVPLSKSLALEALPSDTPQATIQRRVASGGDVAKVNRVQWENSLHIVIGPDPKILRGL